MSRHRFLSFSFYFVRYVCTHVYTQTIILKFPIVLAGIDSMCANYYRSISAENGKYVKSERVVVTKISASAPTFKYPPARGHTPGRL